MSAKRITRRLGIPYKGFTSSVPQHECPIDKVWGAGISGATSQNFLFDPLEGKFFRRSGSLIIGSNGIIENAASRAVTANRARQLLSLDSPTLTSGYPTHAVLMTRESATAANNNSALYVRSTNGSVDYTLGSEFNATNHYPGTTAATFNIKCVPYMRTLDGTWGRLNTATLRACALAGSRNMIEGGDNLYFPCLNSMPMRWNKRLNESSGSGSENLRLMPTGAIPPIGYIVIANNLNGTATSPWQNGDTFYRSVAYQYADGSISLPMIPQSPTVTNVLGFGLTALSASGVSLTWSKIPIGPDGVVGRWLLRSPKVNTVTSTGAVPSPLDLRVTAYIGNNTQDTYVDFNGNDLSLSTRPDIVRFDRILPPPARYISNFDGRYIVGYTKPHSAAIFICGVYNPDGTVEYDDDNVGNIGHTYEFDIGVTAAGKLTLYYDNAQVTQFTLASYTSIADLVQAINDYGFLNYANANKRWFAQIAPGADRGAATSSLAVTTGIAVGDTAARVRVFGASYPGIMHFSTTYLGNYGTQKRTWFFTQGGPGVASNLADAWIAGNYRTGLASWGYYQGSAPLLDGTLLFFTKAIVLFRNVKGGKSGLDDDYHPDDLFTNLGCIAWDSIAYGDGWAGCLTDRGYMVFDGTRGGAVVISPDVYNPTTGLGEWSYEIAQCQDAAGGDNDNANFHAKVMGGKLYCSYRTAGSVCNRMLVYDFSATAGGTGFGQVLQQDGSPWGWSTVQALPYSALGEVRASGGTRRYGFDESNTGPTLNGRIDQFETGTDDSGTPTVGILYGPTDFAESLKLKSAQELVVVHGGNSSVLVVDYFRTDGTTTVQETAGLQLPATSGAFKRTIVPLPQKARSLAVGGSLRFTENGSSQIPTIWGAELELVESNSHV